MGDTWAQGGSILPQDLEISVKELRTILNRIISKREPTGVPWLPPHSPPMACSCLGILPWSVWLGDPLLFLGLPSPQLPSSRAYPAPDFFSPSLCPLLWTPPYFTVSPCPEAFYLCPLPFDTCSYPLCFEAKFVSLRLTRALMVK